MPHGLGTGLKHTWYGGASDASFENIQQVDANGKKLPWPLQGWPDGGAMGPSPENWQKIIKGIQDGTYALPFFGDFPAMSDVERRVTWKLMLGEESTTRNITNSYEKAGFDPAKHLLMNYNFIEGTSPSNWLNSRPRRSRRRLGPEIKPRRSVHRRRINVLRRRPQLGRLDRTVCRPKSRCLCPGDRRRHNLQRPDRSGKSPRLRPDQSQRRHRLERTARRHCPHPAVLGAVNSKQNRCLISGWIP